MKRVFVALFSFIFITSIFAFDASLVPTADAGILVRNQRRILIRLRRVPRMHIQKRYLTSSKVGGRTNPSMNGGGKTLEASKQIDAQQKAEEDYNKKYEKWRQKQIKIEKKAITKQKHENQERAIAAKKAKESQLRKARKVASIKEAPLNPWFGSMNSPKKKKDDSSPGSVMDLGKGKDDATKAKDPTRRVPLLKQIWHAIFGS